MRHLVTVRGLPAWLDLPRLLGEGDWKMTPEEGRLTAQAELPRRAAADLAARLRGLGLDGRALAVEVQPRLPRPWVRAARTEDARRRRDTTPGFSRPGVRLDPEGRRSLTPEALALALGRRAAGREVVDAGCGVGGNAIGFARAGCRVLAIERDPHRLEAARHNASVYGVASRIRFLQADALEHLGGLRGDLLFLDPPWGDWDHTRTTRATLPLLDAALPHAGGFRELWVKVPPSFEVASVEGARAEAFFGLATGDARRVKFVLLTLEVG